MVAPSETHRPHRKSPKTTTEMMALAKRVAMNRLEDVYGPQDSTSVSTGAAPPEQGSSITSRHVVPRWGGDLNFMPKLADHRVISQSLGDSYRVLRGALPDAGPPGGRGNVRRQ